MNPVRPLLISLEGEDSDDDSDEEDGADEGFVAPTEADILSDELFIEPVFDDTEHIAFENLPNALSSAIGFSLR